MYNGTRVNSLFVSVEFGYFSKVYPAQRGSTRCAVFVRALAHSLRMPRNKAVCRRNDDIRWRVSLRMKGADVLHAVSRQQ